MSLVYSAPNLGPSPYSTALNTSVTVNGIEKLINNLNHTRPADQTRFPPGFWSSCYLSLAFLRSNISSCPRNIKETSYRTLVRPHLDYAATVWDTTYKAQISAACRSRPFSVKQHGISWVTTDYRLLTTDGRAASPLYATPATTWQPPDPRITCKSYHDEPCG